MPTRYDDTLTVREARQRYFAESGFDERGYDARWVPIAIGPVRLPLPNTASRKQAVPMHDLHHIATGYGTDLRGEAEIAAWELAAGCGRYAAAWVLNSMSLVMGAVIAPRRTLSAWRWGRACRALYRDGYRDSLLDETVGELRARVGIAGRPG